MDKSILVTSRVAKKAAAFVAAALLLVGARSASADLISLSLGQTVGLSDLIANGDSIQIGDKIFSEFSVDGEINSSSVVIKAIQDLNGYGISIRGGFFAFGNDVTDFRFEFAVEVAPESSQYISDVHLRFNGAVVGNSFAQVVEQIFDGGGNPIGNLLGQISVNNPPQKLEDTFYLATPLKKLYIQKDVLLVSDLEAHKRVGQDFSYSSISIIDQTFSQIPEPSTVVLVAAGLLGVAMTARRRS